MAQDSFGFTAGLAKEVPIDSFVQGVNLRELQEAKKVKAAQEKQAKLDAIMKGTDINGADLLPVIQKEYHDKITPLYQDLMMKQSNGTLTPVEAQNIANNINFISQDYKGKNAELKNQLAYDKKGLTAAGIAYQGHLQNSKSLQEVAEKLKKGYGEHSNAYNPDGCLLYTSDAADERIV